ncbi:MaoC/PaaZ C-terminal domain-containing protein [Amycolatopsis endophytica]|uniref:Acyl dehydratase n=1 Tax=Amycolatopsis endophytica TaxID=860233 RepID=A0A853B178_9PSEU|nr:MaoC/PaaZ C-terminal domain-containing protein [Amycolatopsis endophytica]NYI88699.1 acyl dehydratase [Amycolatopsis endophytica]
MTVDPARVRSLRLPASTFVWSVRDVLQYQLALLGPDADPVDPRQLRYLHEDDLVVLPTFAMTVPAVFGVAAAEHYHPEPPEIRFPGLSLRLGRLLHARQELVSHRPVPARGELRTETTIDAVHDTGNAAVLVQRTEAVGPDDQPLFTSVCDIRAAGEGGFGGPGYPHRRPRRPDREPDLVLHVPTQPQQALLYRMCGDRNPVHVVPAAATAAGFERPFLQGGCTYGMVAKAIVDAVWDGDPDALGRYVAWFTGVVFPGDVLRTGIWTGDGELEFHTTVPERRDAPVLSGTVVSRDRGTPAPRS